MVPDKNARWIMARKSNKESILDAAERVIRQCGLANTTVEMVAAEAGMSKGGLFYHFTSKKEIFQQVLARYSERYLQLRAEIMATLPPSPTRLLKASLLASFQHPVKQAHDITNLLSLLDDVDLRQSIAGMKKRLFDEISAGSRHPEHIAIAMMAIDGMWVAEMFGTPIFTSEFKDRVVKELLRIIDMFDPDTGFKDVFRETQAVG